MSQDSDTQGGPQYDIAAIRTLLRHAFTVDDLRRFCQDRPLFRPIVDRFAPAQGLELMVDQVIDYCQARLLFEELLTEVGKVNPKQYERFEPYLDEVRPRQKVVNLPPWDMPHVFKDRQQEMQALSDYLGDPHVRLISIVGQGGMGKTALACYVLRGFEPKAQPAESSLPAESAVDGILYLSAQDTGTGLDLEQIRAGVELMVDGPTARRLANRWMHGEASLATKVEYLLDATQGGRYLILLDSLENSLTAEGTIEGQGLCLFVEHCLTRPSGAKLIATSRRDIQLAPATLPSIRTIPLQDGLPEKEAASLLRDLDPQGRLGLRDAIVDSLHESSRRLGGVPLALELLAGLLADDQTIQLEELLADEDLIGEEVINRLLDESYQRLDDRERWVMQALAVFDQPVYRKAISFLLYPWFPNLDVRMALQRLIRSFIVTVRRPRGVYSLHPLNREYAYRQMPDDAEPDAYNRHNLEMRAAEYYLGQRRPEDEWQTIEDLEPQLLEFEHRIRAGDYDRAGLLLESIDFDYLSLWGHAGKLVELREKLLKRLTEPGLIANNLGNLGLSYHALGQMERAQACYEQALAIVREIPERQSEGIWLGDLGKAYQDRGRVEQAIVFFEGALDIARETEDRPREGIWLGDLGDAYHDLGQFEKAIGFFEQALEIHEQVGDLRRVGAESGNLGSVYRALGYFEKAIDLYAEALRIARQVGDRWSQGVNLGRLGVAYRHLGKTGLAMEYHEAALSNARAIGHRRIEGRQLGYLGDIYRLLGQTDAASQFLNEALNIARDTDDRRFEGVWLHRLGAVYCDLGQIQQAIAIQREALEITREIGDRRGTSYRLLGLGRLLLANGETVEAERCLQEARRLEASEPHARILLAVGVIHLSQSTALAQETFEESAALCRAMLERTADLYEARFSLATALVGLTICDPQWSEVARRGELLAPALEEYQSALDTCTASGIVRDALLDLRLIPTADTRGIEPAVELLEKALEKG